MTELFKFQDIESGSFEPKVTALASDALTLVVANSNNEVRIHQRLSVEEQFQMSGAYSVHDATVTALALQDGGVHAVSGDEDGWLHLWSTDSVDSSFRQRFPYGRVVSVAISVQFILVSFFDEATEEGHMLLINKGFNLEDPWTVVRTDKGVFSRCAVCEHGKYRTPHIVYYTDKKIVYEFDPNSEGRQGSIAFRQEVPPWCMRRNTATATLLVFGILVQRKLLLWAPMNPPAKENPIAFKMTSKESLRINQSLVMSSVVRSSMFLASIYDGAVHIIRVRRTVDIEKNNEENTEAKAGNDAEAGSDEQSKLLETSVQGMQKSESASDGTLGEVEACDSEKTVMQIMADHVLDPLKPLNANSGSAPFESSNPLEEDTKAAKTDINVVPSITEADTESPLDDALGCTANLKMRLTPISEPVKNETKAAFHEPLGVPQTEYDSSTEAPCDTTPQNKEHSSSMDSTNPQGMCLFREEIASSHDQTASLHESRAADIVLNEHQDDEEIVTEVSADAELMANKFWDLF